MLRQCKRRGVSEAAVTASHDGKLASLVRSFADCRQVIAVAYVVVVEVVVVVVVVAVVVVVVVVLPPA